MRLCQLEVYTAFHVLCQLEEMASSPKSSTKAQNAVLNVRVQQCRSAEFDWEVIPDRLRDVSGKEHRYSIYGTATKIVCISHRAVNRLLELSVFLQLQCWPGCC